MEKLTGAPSLGTDPYIEFENWYKLAQDAKMEYADAMTLATSDQNGKPSARIVLFKGFNQGGLTFYTNYESHKSKELMANPQASVVFFWAPIYRQIRIEGTIEKLSRTDSEKYFASRPRDSQLGAWASDQSQKISDFDLLEKKFDALEKQYAGIEIPCPPHWGGFRIVPLKFEFWWGGTRRLHYRFLYEKAPHGWTLSKLSP